MVPKKSKSHRVSAAHKYKVQKKVAEAHRKARKEAKKNPKKKLKKDPGIPNLFPFKEKLIAQALAKKKEKFDEKKPKSLNQLLTNALKSQEIKEQNIVEEKGIIVDNSKKAYFKEFKKVVEEADVILEILDARDPLGCRTRHIEEMILSSQKRIILILNKIDLVPREIVQEWLKYLRNEFPTVAFKASTQSQRQNLKISKIDTDIANEALLGSSECLGADNLIKLLKNYSRNNKIKTSITVGVVGYPNVGKSSVINSLKRAKVCNVGSTPGLTKSTQLIHLDKNIKLMDCPGIVFSKPKNESDEASVLLRNCVKVELIQDPISPVEAIVSRCAPEQLMKLYNVPFFNSAKDFLLHLALNRGKLKKRGIPDLENAARSVLQDWNSGRIPYFTAPPAESLATKSHISTSIVSQWSKEFSLDDVVAVEGKDLDGIRSKSEISHRLVPFKPSSILEMDLDHEIQGEDMDI